jgi:hypothetical protein
VSPGGIWRRLSKEAQRAAAAVATVLMRRAGALPARVEEMIARIAASSRALRELGLAELSADRLLALRRESDLRWLLKPGTPRTVGQLLDLGSQHPDLDAAVIARFRGAEDRALSEELYRAIVLDQAGAPRRLALALTVVNLQADRLAGDNRRSIFTRCLDLATRPADPYDATASLTSGPAVQAASALLAVDSGLDPIVLEALADQGRRPNVQALSASALKERPAYAFERLTKYLGAAPFTQETAIRFAEDCDAERSSLRSIAHPRRSPPMHAAAAVWRMLPRGWLSYVAATVLPALAAAALALVCRHATGAITTAGIEPGVAVGALALLAAVNVLSVQLAAQRLPGPIAAGSVAPPLTVGAYVSAILMLACSILGEESPPPSWNPALVAGGLLVIVVLLAIASTVVSLRATTLAAAAETVGRRSAGLARRSGRRVGRLHRCAAQTQLLLGRTPSIRQFNSPPETTHRAMIRARSSGYARVDASRLERAVSGARWREGDIRLDLVVRSGVAVEKDQELASIVPAAGSDVHEAEISGVQAALSSRVERGIERCGELCVTLCAQLPLLVRAGDPGGASRVLEALLALLDTHVRADIRKWAPAEEQMLLSPVVVQTIGQALTDMKSAHSDGEREMTARLLGRLVDRSRKDDGLIMLLALKLTSARTLTEFGVLYSAGCRAARDGSGAGVRSTQMCFEKLTAGTNDVNRYANEYAARLVAYCAAVAPWLSRSAWSRWWETAGFAPASDVRTLAVRIGAGALPVGNLSLAVEIVLALRQIGVDFDAMEAAAHDADRAQLEQFLSESYGRLLGSDPEKRIADFLTFAREVSAAVPEP